MSTEAQLKAISNSELASGNQIPALKHRTVNNAIIEEMYDAQSRGNVLAGVQSAVSIASGDQVLVIRSGQAYLLDSSEFGFVDALADLTDVSIPTPANDQVLAYNTSTSKWVAKDVNTLTSVVTISGTATTNALTKFTGTSSIGNSNIVDDGSTIALTGNLAVNTNDLYINSSNSRVGIGTASPSTTLHVVGNILADFVSTTGNSYTKIFSMDQDIQTTDSVEFLNVTAGSFITSGGTSNDFVKGDGSLDSTDYQGQIDAEEAARIAADSNLQSQVTTNASNISTNASNISTNASNIATNTADIITNQNNIAANTSDIATNTSNIAANTSDITDLQNDKQDISEKNQANGYAPLDSGAKIPLANLPDSVLGQVTYEGTWNASTNTPTLANPPASTTKGDYYVVNTGGTQFSIDFQVGDWIISNGSAWEKVDNTDAVTSVFGRLGNVVANAGDYASFYPPVSRTISAGTGLTGGGDLSANRTISHDDTSSQGSVNNSGLTFIQDVTLDGFGHVTGLGSATVTLPTVNNSTITLSAGTGLSGGGDFTLNQGSAETITFNNTDRGSSQNIFKNVAVSGQSTIIADSNNDTLTFAAGTNVTIATDASTDTITINSTDQFTGTVTSVATGSGLTGGTITTSGTISHADTSSQGSVDNSGGTVIQDVTLDGFGHVTGLASIDLDSRYVQSLTDTLDSVTTRGNTTTNAITVGGATINGNLAVDTDTLFVDSANNRVGIGTSSPDGIKLDVRGVIQSKGADSLIRIGELSSTSTYLQSISSDFTTSRDFVFFNTSERMRIDSSGNVSIGTTMSLGTFTVNGGTTTVAGASNVSTALSDFTNSTLYVSHPSGNGNTVLLVGSSQIGFATTDNTTTTERMRIDSSGNVGIGTSSPNSAGLTIFKEAGSAVTCQNSVTGTGSAAGFQFGTGSGGDGYIWNYSNSFMAFATNNTERMRITSAGNVGIGTSSPGIDKLAVIGNVLISGSLSKGSGSFKIDHPLPEKKDTHHLVHSFVEAPQADNIYRGKVELSDGKAIVNLDEAGRMTEGTFVLLNGNIQCLTSNESGWTAIRGKVEGNILTIEAQDTECTDTVSWLVIGERIDQHMIDTEWTDENGRVITEPLKKVEPTPENNEEEEATIVDNGQ